MANKEIPAGMRKVTWGKVGKETRSNFYIFAIMTVAAMLVLKILLSLWEMCWLKPLLVCRESGNRRHPQEYERDRDNPRARHCGTCFVE